MILLLVPLVSATLNCTISDVTCTDTDVFHLSNLSNAHAEQNNESGFNVTVCCSETGGDNLSTTGTAVINLSTSTNAHVEQTNETDYPFSVLLSADSGNITCSYSTGSCAEACLGSISTNITDSYTNLHIAQCDDYETNICCHYNATTAVVTPAAGGGGGYAQSVLDIKQALCMGEWIDGECIRERIPTISWWIILGILFIIAMLINIIVKKKEKDKEKGGKKKWWNSVWERFSSLG